MTESQIFAVAFFGTIAALLLGIWIFRRSGVVVKPYQSVLILHFGRCLEELREPGYHLRPRLWIPGHRKITVSRRLGYERFGDLHVNDRDGTTLRVDVWVEYRIKDARASVFAVEVWQQAVRNLILHSLVAKMGSTGLEDLLANRVAISSGVLEEVRVEAAAWGINLEQLHIQDVRLLPEIGKRFFDRVAAQLEMKKARLEEEGRTRAQILRANMEKKIAGLQAEARAMHPRAVGRAYQKMNREPKILDAFETLHQLSMIQPGKTVSFVGFKDGEIRPQDALMIPPPADGGSTPSRVDGEEESVYADGNPNHNA